MIRGSCVKGWLNACRVESPGKLAFNFNLIIVVNGGKGLTIFLESSCRINQGFSYLPEVGARGLLNLGEKSILTIKVLKT